MESDFKYYDSTFGSDLKAVFKNTVLKKNVLIVDIIIKPSVIPGEPSYLRKERWTDEEPCELSAKGYREIIGLHDSIAWSKVKIYCKISNGEMFNIHQTDEKGRFYFSQDTSATLNDFMQSSATRDFIKGMGKTALPEMDIQKIIFIAIIGIGAIFGLKMLGVF